MIDVVVSDLDSTLAHTLHRSHLAPEDKINGDWLPFSMACFDDAVIEGTATALRLLGQTYPIFLVSGRSVEAYQSTLFWLDEKAGVTFESLRLHRAGDPHHNGQYKVQYIRQLREDGYNPILMFEDWPDVAEMIEAEGVPVLCVNPRYHDNVMNTFAQQYGAVTP